ncbi:hypothetical protein NKI56_08635 [Mesorhizobium sp. M0622]|uniref:hypothetical protein n=1 Tax=unclassified Mesorhizobium TaxID=325217 RepID=UPI00333A2573
MAGFVAFIRGNFRNGPMQIFASGELAFEDSKMTIPEPNWPFADPPNVAVITTRKIIGGHHDIDYVTHDEDDGQWQFLNLNAGADIADAVLVGLAKMIDIDGSLRELSDLPLGWCAWRHKDGPWQRAETEEETALL